MSVSRIRIAPEGPTFSRFVMGYWRLMEWGLDSAGLVAFIEGCLDLGVTTVDHADIYGGYRVEAEFGRALAMQPALRERMEIVSKCGISLVAPGRPHTRVKHYDSGAAHIQASVERSLADLHTDYLDLLLLHRPDPLMDADEVAAAFVALHESGKVLHFGVSNFRPHQFDLLADRLALPAGHQPARDLALQPVGASSTASSTSASACASPPWPGAVWAAGGCSTRRTRPARDCAGSWGRRRRPWEIRARSSWSTPG